MTLGERRRKNPEWHFRYYLTTLDIETLKRVYRELTSTLPSDVFYDDRPSWIIYTEGMIYDEIIWRGIDDHR